MKSTDDAQLIFLSEHIHKFKGDPLLFFNAMEKVSKKYALWGNFLQLKIITASASYWVNSMQYLAVLVKEKDTSLMI